MKYACLIYWTEGGPDTPQPGSPEHQAMVDGYFQFTRDAMEAGVHVAGEALESITSATSVQLREGEVIATDGPFAETKEQLGGFYIIDCENLDEAISWAARIPSAAHGTIEVRPVPSYDLPDMDDGAG